MRTRCLASVKIMTFVIIVGVMEILCSFRLVRYRKIGKEIHKSLSLELLEKFLANNCALSDAGHSSGSFNRRLIADLLFLEATDFFVLVAYANLAASRTI